MFSRYGRAVLAAGAILILSAAPARGQRLDLPDGVFYYQPAASVFGAEAAWVNPAGLARYNASSFQVLAEYADDSFGRSWGIVTNRDRMALAYRFLYNPSGDDYKEYIFGLAMSLGATLNLGGSYRYFKDGPDDFHHRHLWNLGLTGGRGKLRWAAILENLNHSRNEEGRRTETEQRYSVACRPLGTQLTLAVDLFLSTGTRLSNADYVYHFSIASRHGLYLTGLVDSDGDFQAGLRVNLLQYFVGSQVHFNDRAAHQHSTVYFGATSLRQPSLIPPPRRRLAMNIGASIPENPPQPILGHSRTPFASVILNIYRAAEDPSIGEMVLCLKGLSLGFAQAQELRQALDFFKRQGKAITCHMSSPNNIGYYVASAANRILIPPVSQLNLVGLRAELTFYAGTLQKLGIRADVVRIGDYKTAAEKYARDSSSPENRRQINRLLDDLYDQFVSGIAEGRGLTADSVKGIIDNGPFTSKEALEYGLVDGLSYRDELSRNSLSPLPEISFRKYLADTLLNDGWPERPVLAVVVADGEIAPDATGLLPFGHGHSVTPREMGRAFERAAVEPRVRGIIFRIDSPGGWALAGESIHRSCQKARTKKPIIVSMANVAASGGYYIAMPCDRLFASPASITGSIGIYGGKPDLSGLYEKIELGKELYTRGKFAGMLSWTRPFSDDERNKYHSHMMALYDHFLGLVSENRALPTDSIDILAGGRVWTGREALSNGLVDESGGLKETLDYASGRLGLEDYRIAVYPRRRPLFVLPGSSLVRAVAGLVLGDDGAAGLPPLSTPPVFAEGFYTRMPFDIGIE